MGKTVTVPLDDSIVGHEGPITNVVLREPNFTDFMDLGDPYTVAYSSNGTPFFAEDLPTINAYLDRLVVAPKDRLLLEQGTLSDARRVKAALLGFFQSRTKAVAPSESSPTSSSSPSSENPE